MKTLYYGGRILTLAEPLYAEAVIVEDGRFFAVGDEAELRAMLGEGDAEYDLAGRVMMASFIDAHGHFNSMSARNMQCSVRDVDSVEEIAARIGAFIKRMEIPEGAWVTATDYDENLLPGHKNPPLEIIDSLCPRNPLRIMHKSGHASLINSRALELCSITADTPDPKGGEIGRCEDGSPNGYLSEAAMGLCNRHVPNISDEDMRRGCIPAQRQYASYGITTVQDGFLTSRMLDIYLSLAESDELKLDVIGYVPVGAYEKLREAYDGKINDPRVKIGGIKTFADGSPQLRTAWLRTPYLDSDSCGEPNRTDAAMLDGMRLAAKHHAQVLCHANGDAAVEQFLRSVEQVEEEAGDFYLTRPVVIHAQLMGLDQLPLAKKTGAVVSFFVAHTYYWADAHIRNLGMDRAVRISPVRSALEHGVAVTFHQDPPVILPNMFETVWAAVNRTSRDGVKLAGEEISALEAIRAVTIGAAYQYHEENIKGSIECGKQADYIIIDRDPLTVPPSELKDIRVLHTYKRGECIYSLEQ